MAAYDELLTDRILGFLRESETPLSMRDLHQRVLPIALSTVTNRVNMLLDGGYIRIAGWKELYPHSALYAIVPGSEFVDRKKTG